jgi:hypothetical protein
MIDRESPSQRLTVGTQLGIYRVDALIGRRGCQGIQSDLKVIENFR